MDLELGTRGVCVSFSLLAHLIRDDDEKLFNSFLAWGINQNIDIARSQLLTNDLLAYNQPFVRPVHVSCLERYVGLAASRHAFNVVYLGFTEFMGHFSVTPDPRQIPADKSFFVPTLKDLLTLMETCDQPDDRYQDPFSDATFQADLLFQLYLELRPISPATVAIMFPYLIMCYKRNWSPYTHLEKLSGTTFLALLRGLYVSQRSSVGAIVRHLDDGAEEKILGSQAWARVKEYAAQFCSMPTFSFLFGFEIGEMEERRRIGEQICNPICASPKTDDMETEESFYSECFIDEKFLLDNCIWRPSQRISPVGPAACWLRKATKTTMLPPTDEGFVFPNPVWSNPLSHQQEPSFSSALCSSQNELSPVLTVNQNVFEEDSLEDQVSSVNTRTANDAKSALPISLRTPQTADRDRSLVTESSSSEDEIDVVGGIDSELETENDSICEECVVETNTSAPSLPTDFYPISFVTTIASADGPFFSSFAAFDRCLSQSVRRGCNTSEPLDLQSVTRSDLGEDAQILLTPPSSRGEENETFDDYIAKENEETNERWQRMLQEGSAGATNGKSFHVVLLDANLCLPKRCIRHASFLDTLNRKMLKDVLQTPEISVRQFQMVFMMQRMPHWYSALRWSDVVDLVIGCRAFGFFPDFAVLPSLTKEMGMQLDAVLDLWYRWMHSNITTEQLAFCVAVQYCTAPQHIESCQQQMKEVLHRTRPMTYPRNLTLLQRFAVASRIVFLMQNRAQVYETRLD